MTTRKGHESAKPSKKGGEGKAAQNQRDAKFSGHTDKYESSLDEIRSVLEEYKFVENREKPKQLGTLLLPSIKRAFQKTAEIQDMSFSEFLRRAAFAAQADPSILRRDDVDEAERQYKEALGASRWTRENE